MSKTLYMVLFAIVATTVITSIHYYLWIRLVRDAGLPAPWRTIATWAIIVLCASIPLAMIVGRGIPFGTSRILVWAPYLWIGVMMLLFFTLLTVDAVKLMAFMVKKVTVGGSLIADPERRRVMGRIVAGAATVAVGGLSGIAVVKAAKRAVIKKLEINLPRLPRNLDGLKIVQLSDLHLGLTHGGRWLEDIVRRVNALEPDLIVVTGDIIDGRVEQLEKEIAPLRDLEAPHGVYFVTGNHEYYFGVSEWLPAVAKLGIRVLRNERVKIGQGDDFFYLAGVDDYNSEGMEPGHGQDIEKALEGREPDVEVVLLAHQPRAVHQAAEMDVGLVLCGHTHGGQIWPFTYLVGLQQPYNKGLHRHGERTWIYVSQGAGVWGPPMRLGTEGEITEISLRAG